MKMCITSDCHLKIHTQFFIYNTSLNSVTVLNTMTDITFLEALSHLITSPHRGARESSDRNFILYYTFYYILQESLQLTYNANAFEY